MLDQLRRHASSWLIKAILGLIVLTFIFFFGYSRISSRYEDAHLYAAVVGDTAITRRKFETTYQTSLDRLRENFKGELPANMSEYLRKNVLDQMINREILVKYAERLGLSISDEELAKSIETNRNLFPDGHFDLSVYQQRFLPYYQQNFGENFEEVMRRDLLIEKVESYAPILFGPWQAELDHSLEVINAAKQKKPSPETTPTLPQLTSSLSPDNLFSLWVDKYREKVKVQVLEQ